MISSECFHFDWVMKVILEHWQLEFKMIQKNYDLQRYRDLRICEIHTQHPCFIQGYAYWSATNFFCCITTWDAAVFIRWISCHTSTEALGTIENSRIPCATLWMLLTCFLSVSNMGTLLLIKLLLAEVYAVRRRICSCRRFSQLVSFSSTWCWICPFKTSNIIPL